MNFLDRVLKEKEREIAHKKSAVPVGDLKRLVSKTPPRDFTGALSGGSRIIAEVKKRSPRVLSFRQTGAVDTLAPIYEESGAAAISVVTDAANFGTSLSDVRRIRSQVQLPVLVKDFILDPYQVFEARAAGADAVLLISRIVTVDTLAALLELTHSLGMHSLVEVHSADDVEKALLAGAPVVGINNRDLDSLEVSLGTTRNLIRVIPQEAVIVSESGISRREHIEELSALGVDAFLIGGALLQSSDPGALLRTLAGGGTNETIE